MLAICTPTERVSELKNLVKSDPEAFWIGAFSFIRVPPETQASPAPSKGHGAKPYDDWVDVASIFSGPEYQDPNTARILKVVSGQHTHFLFQISCG